MYVQTNIIYFDFRLAPGQCKCAVPRYIFFRKHEINHFNPFLNRYRCILLFLLKCVRALARFYPGRSPFVVKQCLLLNDINRLGDKSVVSISYYLFSQRKNLYAASIYTLEINPYPLSIHVVFSSRVGYNMYRRANSTYCR